MKLDHRVRELIAVGTAVGANCHACLEYHVAKARDRGILEDEIAEAIDVGKAVRRGAQDKMDKLASDLMDRTRDALAPLGCGCHA
jgi:AhpD family alkylhydroperoxidase